MAPDILKSSLQDATFNIIFQIAFRILTFLLNALVLRHIGTAAIGVMNVRLLLLESTILFLSREAFRRACLSKAVDHNWHQVVNLIWLTVPLSCILSTFFGYIWLYLLATPDPSITPYYTFGVWCMAGSCILEMCCEPAYLAGQAFLFIRLKVVMDTVQVLVRTVIFTTMVLWQWDAVLAFSIAQVASISTLVACYYLYFHRYMEGRKRKRRDSLEGSPYYFPFSCVRDFLPFSGNEYTVDYRLARLTWSFLKQGILKQILTEGERYVMTIFSVMSFQEQGVYDVVNNLGSLAARFLFRPIEDSSYFYFSQMVRRDAHISEQDHNQMEETANVLRRLIRCLLAFGLLILVMGQAYAKLVLSVYGGQTLLEGPGPILLRAHCLSVLLLATNGVTECFALATMNTQELDRYNYVMAGLSVAFLVVSLILTSLFGGVGFIIANCCNMAARITYRYTIEEDKLIVDVLSSPQYTQLPIYSKQVWNEVARQFQIKRTEGSPGFYADRTRVGLTNHFMKTMLSDPHGIVEVPGTLIRKYLAPFNKEIQGDEGSSSQPASQSQQTNLQDSWIKELQEAPYEVDFSKIGEAPSPSISTSDDLGSDLKYLEDSEDFYFEDMEE